MFPGMGGGGRGGMNPRKLNQMMRQLGIDVEDVPNVEEVVIRTATEEIVIKDAEVTIMTAQGTRTFQIVGEESRRALGEGGGEAAAPAAAEEEEAGPLFTDDDVKLVAEHAGVSPSKAREALEETEGETAEAILKLTEE